MRAGRASLLAAVLCPSLERAGWAVTFAPALLVAVAFAAVSVSSWAWVKA